MTEPLLGLKRISSWGAIAALAVVSTGVVFFRHQGNVRADSSDQGSARSIVGAWEVDAIGAPFVPHVMSFHSDGTMLIDNPEAGDPHTSDSLGLGPWSH